MNTAQSWFRRYRPIADPDLRLVCLPHAGGTPAAYRTWPGRFSDRVEVLGVCYPGRQDRLAEPCITTMAEMVDALVAQVRTLGDRPFVLFGHSMGASIAFEVALAMQDDDIRPQALLLSGRRPPRLLTGRAPYLGGDAEIVADVHRLGEASAAVLDDPDLAELVLPAIRADYRLLGTYVPSADTLSTTAITAYVGDADPDITAEHTRVWAEYTQGEFEHRVFAGDHFYLGAAEDALTQDIAARIAGVAAAAQPS